ncbi:hypothetical protein GQ53DRAFT_862576, partial [Thozetella sp. PMI_491]
PALATASCEACKQKKSRCDSGRPQCDPCRRKGVACIYREKGQPGLRPGYGKAIESRLSVLEGNMEKISESVDAMLSYMRAGQVSHASLPFPAEQPAESDTPGTAEEARQAGQDLAGFVPNVVTDTSGTAAGRALLAMASTAANKDNLIWQPSQPMPDVQSYHSTPSSLLMQPALSSHHDAGNIVSPDGSFPPIDVLRELVDLFFELIHPWLPLFFKPNFTATMFSPERQLLLHGIVLVTFRFWRKPEPPPEVRDAYVKGSLEQILYRTFDACTVTSTQALTLLALDALGQGSGPRTWNVMSMLVCAAKHLCLSRAAINSGFEANAPLVRNEDSSDGLDQSSIEAEEKRRLYWAIYSLDRLSSASHGQPPGTDTNKIRLPYPVAEEDWGLPLVPEWFQPTGQAKHNHRVNLWHHYIDLLALVDRSHALLIEPISYSIPAHCREWQSSFRRIDIMLSTWFENVSPEVREPPVQFNPMWIMVQATFHLIRARMYTVAAFPSTTSPYLRPSPSARTRCRQTVRDIASLASSVQPEELDQLGPMFAFVIWVAARSSIILWTTGYESTCGPMPADLEPLLGRLRLMATRWGCAQQYVNLIQLILDTKDNPGGPTGLDIFNDTSRTAYGLQHRLGMLTGHQLPEFDFLDMQILNVGDLTTSWNAPFGTDTDGDWL